MILQCQAVVVRAIYLKNSAQMQIDWLDFYGTNANVQLTVYENLLSKQTELDEDRIDI